MSGSDDFTLFLVPAEDKKPLARMTGHQALINQVVFSPDSASSARASLTSPSAMGRQDGQVSGGVWAREEGCSPPGRASAFCCFLTVWLWQVVGFFLIFILFRFIFLALLHLPVCTFAGFL